MKTETTIQLNGQEVTMRYCTAAETGYENMSGKSSEVFLPTIKKDEDGNVSDVTPPAAKLGDYVTLALAAIIASYTARGEDAPIDSSYLMYDATPDEIKVLVAAVAQLRAEWYKVPTVVEPEQPQKQEKGKKTKNA